MLKDIPFEVVTVADAGALELPLARRRTQLPTKLDHFIRATAMLETKWINLIWQLSLLV